MGLVAPWHVEPTRTWGRTGVPCIGRWILSHWTTSKVRGFILNASTEWEGREGRGWREDQTEYFKLTHMFSVSETPPLPGLQKEEAYRVVP